MHTNTGSFAPSPAVTAVVAEIPPSPALQWNPFDPAWIKVWEEVGPIGYLGLLCLFVWLLTRFVETVKGK